MRNDEVLKVLVEQTRAILDGQAAVEGRLARLEEAHRLGLDKEAYRTDEVAERLSRAPWTVRQWCNEGRARAEKVPGKGRTGEWRVPHDELLRLQKERPRPEGTFANGRSTEAAA